jgi:hypothetical protein
MPPLPRFNTGAVHDLLEQLRYAPLATRRRQMDASEALVEQIDPDRAYPADFVVYRVTGFRPEHGGDVMLAGAALRADLVALVQHLSRDAEIELASSARQALRLDDAARRLGVSAKTLQRYRRQGLVCHFVSVPEGGQRLVCFADALERFAGAHRARIEHAASFTRLGPAAEAQIVAEAEAMRRDDAGAGRSRNTVASKLAQRHGRSLEAMRSLLRRSEERGALQPFADAPPLEQRGRALLLRAWRFGVAPARLARRFGKSPSAIHKAIAFHRRQRLVELRLTWVELPTFALSDAEAVILAAPAVQAGLDCDFPGADVLDLVEAARSAAPIDSESAQAMVAAFNLLKRRAAGALAASPAYPSGAALDAIETDLRWAALLARRLASLTFGSALRAIEQHLHRRLIELPAEQMTLLVRLALDIIGRSIAAFDPGRTQRLDRLVAYSMDRSLAALPPHEVAARASARAAARHQPHSVRLTRAQQILVPWQAWLEPPPQWKGHVSALDAASRRAIALRYGWEGTPPLSIRALAAGLGLSDRRAARLLWRAEAALRHQARLPQSLSPLVP